jgi:hypothetical protein
MRLSRAAGPAFAASCLALLLAAACGNSEGSNGNGSGDTAGSAGSAGTSGPDGPDLVVGGSDGMGPDDSSGGEDTCAGELIEGKHVPLDMYVMLDVSGSMLEVTEGDANITKWQAVSSALSDFVKDDASDGIGMGLQVFPIRHPDAPASCTSSAECGAFGPCFRKLCTGYTSIVVCDRKQDCGFLGGSCVDFGFCTNDENIVCTPVGGTCTDDDDQPVGDCVQPATSPCLSTADCRPATYAAPVTPIAELPAAREALLGAIEMAEPDRDGGTPTAPALQGAIEQAAAWATAHPERQVVALLATDGLPTECTPTEIDDVAAVAASGANGTPAVSTFVIGVFGSADADAPGNLDAIAMAGGTAEAFLVDTQGDVAMQFRDALNQIRASRLSCDLLVPQADAGKTVDYDYVNVVFDNGTSPAETIDYVTDGSGCDPTNGGWYFDKDPDSGDVPEHILVCPSTCTKFKAADAGSVQIKLGCLRREPVK